MCHGLRALLVIQVEWPSHYWYSSERGVGDGERVALISVLNARVAS